MYRVIRQTQTEYEGDSGGRLAWLSVHNAGRRDGVKATGGWFESGGTERDKVEEHKVGETKS